LDVAIEDALGRLPPELRSRIVREAPLAPFTSLQVGGPAEALLTVCREDELAEAVLAACSAGVPWFVLGGGTNLCVSDAGVRGLVIRNRAREATFGETTRVATGHSLMRLFVEAASRGLGGLEFAVGIPGTVGGALVSNAGAYRHSIAPLVRSLTVVEAGSVRTVDASWMQFGYRDSRLRRSADATECLISVELALTPRPVAEIQDEAREYQRNRIQRQPWQPSAGSFFKNVYDADLAQRVEGLPDDLRAAGVIPAGYLSAACGCKGLRVGGAEVSPKHGNFIVNVGGATPQDVRTLAEMVKRRVADRFGITLQEEVIYVGSW